MITHSEPGAPWVAVCSLRRDVKGDNTLVRRSDSRLFLTDFGSSIYPGADTLTPSPIPPGTPAYRSPEAWLFSIQHSRTATTHYTAGPADDLYALGVTACRLVTGAYPAMGEPQRDEHGTWRLESLVLPKALHSARVESPLRALILRMLSVRPEERGTAAQLAQELERAATSLADSSSAPSSLRAHTRSWRSWLATAAAVGTLATWVGWMALGTSGDSPRAARTETTAAEQKDTGPVGLGETAASTSTGDSPAPSTPEAVAAEIPPEPLPGQAAPDARGRCPHKRQVVLNGGCWRKTLVDQCEEFSGRMYKGACYVPIFPPGRPSTATPTKQP
jgi:serine/threonine protein kinase